MPVAIGTAIVWAASFVGPIGTSFTIAGISFSTVEVVGTAALLAANIGITAALQPSAQNQHQKQNLKQPVPARRRYYGRNKAGGALAFLKPREGVLYQVVMLNNGEIDGIETHWLGNRQVTIDGSGLVTALADPQGNSVPNVYHLNGFDFAHIETRPGTDTQTAYTSIISAFPAGTWTTDHRLLGIATTLVRLGSPKPAEFSKVFPNGLPQYNATFRGVKVWDPRDTAKTISAVDVDGTFHTSSSHGLLAGDSIVALDTLTTFVNGQGKTVPVEGRFSILAAPSATSFTLLGPDGAALVPVAHAAGGNVTKLAWSNNAALVILDYLVSSEGMRIGYSRLVPAIDDWIAAANICDETVTFADGSTTDARYHLDFGYDETQAPKDIIPQMLLACDGWLTMRSDGAISLQVGKWDAPTVTLGPTVIKSVQFQRGNGPLRTANEIRATFVDPGQAYQSVEAQPWRDEDDIAGRGEVISKSLDLGMLQSENAARRLMKLAMARLNPRWTGTITTNFGGLDAIGERRVTVVYPRRAINEIFEITSGPKVDLTNGTLTFGVQSIASTAYDFDASTEEGVAQRIPDQIPDATVEAPVGFAVTVQPYPLTGSTTSSILQAVWSAPVKDHLSAHVEYRTHDALVSDDAAEWIPMLDVDDTVHIARSGQMSEGTYDARMHFTNQQGIDGAYAYVRSILVTYSGDAGPITGLDFSNPANSGYLALLEDA